MQQKLGKDIIVSFSSGQDSTTVLYWAKKYFDNVHAITFNYGQRHSIEIDCSKVIAKIAGLASHEIVQVPNCLISSSPLTSNNELEIYQNYEQMDNVIGNRREMTFVPMRNALFLTIIANRAESLGIKNIALGVCQLDNANYDDCREVFIKNTQDYINTALGHDHRGTGEIKIHTPLMYLSKAQTVKLAKELNNGCWEALAYSHTSYDGQYPPISMNHSNVLRAQGFLEADLPDPLVLRAVSEGLMELPDTDNYKNVSTNFRS